MWRRAFLEIKQKSFYNEATWIGFLLSGYCVMIIIGTSILTSQALAWRSGEDFLRPRLPDASIKKQLATLLLLRLNLPGTDVGKVKKEAISLLGIHQSSLVQHLGELVREDAFGGSSLEGLFLKLALEGGGGIGKDVLLKLTLKEQHLGQASPEHLMILAHELAHCGREADGARMAALAARAFAAKGMVRESQNAYLKGFGMDHTNEEIAAGAARSIAASAGLEKAKSQVSLLEIGASLVWDLSTYDFTNIPKGHVQRSETFQLPCGVNAWMHLRPKGHSKSSDGRAALFLHVDKPATVKWTLQSGSSKVFATEHDFSKDLDKDGKPSQGWGWHDFMPISETNGSITLRILSVHLPGSELRYGVQEDRYTKLEEQLHSSQKRCEELQDSHRALEARLQVPRVESGGSLVWDLSRDDFTNFTKGQAQCSKIFQLPCGVNAWMDLRPKGHSKSCNGMAALFLFVDKPAVVKWTLQSGSGEVFTMERDFSTDLDKDGKPLGRGWRDFMPISEANGSLTLRILSVQLPGSELRLQEHEDRYTKLKKKVEACEANFRKAEARYDERKSNRCCWQVILVALNLMLAAAVWGHHGNQARNKLQETCESQKCATDTATSLLSNSSELQPHNCSDRGEDAVTVPRMDIISLAWDLSTYDFTNFTKGQVQRSETFQLRDDVNAWMDLRPKGHSKSSEGMAAVFLHVDRPAVVKWTWQPNGGEIFTMERDFSKASLDKNGRPKGWGKFKFMPIFETNGSITLSVLSVQLSGSKLRYVGSLSGRSFLEMSKTVQESHSRAQEVGKALVLVEQEVARMRLEWQEHIEKVEKAGLEKLEEKVISWQEHLQDLEAKSLKRVDAALANHMVSWLFRHEGLERSVGDLWGMVIFMVVCVVALGLWLAASEQHRLELGNVKSPAPRLEIGASLVWDLSKYDFTTFAKGQVQRSETFQLPNRIKAWLDLRPKGDSRSSNGMAALFLWVDQPAVVKWTWQSGSGEVITMEHDFSKDLDKDGKPSQAWGWLNFMPISEINGSITLRILSVQLPGSALQLT